MSAMQYSTVQKGWNYFIILYSQQINIFHPNLLVNNHIHLPRKKSSNEVSIFLPLFACLKILVICGGVTLCIPAADASSIYLYCIQSHMYRYALYNNVPSFYMGSCKAVPLKVLLWKNVNVLVTFNILYPL